MSAKMLSSLRDENRDMRKQIGCMNGIFQLFDRRHFLTGGSLSSLHHKRLLPGAQLEPHNARKAVMEKDPKEKTQTSSEPPPDYIRQRNTSESPSRITAIEQKGSMYREARGVPIKSFANDERKVTVMKHVDSPRASKSGKPKASAYEGPRNSKDERLALSRFSYDGRESRDTFKMNMKLKEFPRFSLDSKASSMKCSSLDLRVNPLTENEKAHTLSQESGGGHSRSNSIIAKLMGLDDVPDCISTDESSITKSKSSPIPSPRVAFPSELSAERSKQKQVSSSPQKKNPASPSARLQNFNSVRKTATCSRLPIEPAPWKQQDYSQGSMKMATPSGKTPKNSSHPSSSVYGEIEKRIGDLQFNRSGKDLRALKQILEAMQKTRQRLENQIGESAELNMQVRSNMENSCSNQNSSSSMIKNRKTYHQQVPTIKKNRPPPCIEMTEKGKTSSSNWVSKMETRENPAHNERAKYRTPRNNMKETSQSIPSNDKKIIWRGVEQEQTLKAPQCMRVENCITSAGGFGMMSPRVQYIVVKTERESHPDKSISDSGRVKKRSSKEVRERSPRNRNHRVKPTGLQLSDDQLSNLSSETRYSSYQGDTASTKSESNNSIASNIETEAISMANSIKTSCRGQQDYVTSSKAQLPAIELAITTMEQPSPVSVLDTPFYSEGSPSPVKKISTAFRDEGPSIDEGEWHLKNLHHLIDCRKSDSGYKNNQKSDNMLQLVHEPRLLKTKANETARDHHESACQSINQGYRNITKILLASGLLKDKSIIPTANQLLSSCHLIDSDVLKALEGTDNLIEEAIGELIEKNDQVKLNKKIQRKIVSDMMNEILVRKMTSGGLFTLGRKRMSLQGLIKEVHLEMDHLCRKPHCNLDDEDDGSIRLLTADMKYESDDWTDNNGEVPAIVLDIERLIFKDLINEVVTCEVGLHDWQNRHCRQLFTQ